MILIIYAVVFVVYLMCPRFIRPLIFIANLFMPDALPVVDEALMLVTMFA